MITGKFGPQAGRAPRFAPLLLFFFAATVHASPGTVDPLKPPDDETLREAKRLVEHMQNAPKGPYSRIRWYCRDGSVLPPEPYACVPHGGGRQHAEYSPDRARLAELGFHTGTIFAALTWEAFWDDQQRQRRIRELALESYLIDVDDGWVLRKARDYRGRVQIEDEEAAGRRLLLRLLSDTEWLTENFLLARETVRVVPHSGGEDLTRAIRRGAQDLAEADAGFEALRIEIHSAPTAKSAARVRAWAERRSGEAADLAGRAMRLADELDMLYGKNGRAARLEAARAFLSGHEETRPLAALLETGSQDGAKRVAVTSQALFELRRVIGSDVPAPLRLQLFDLLDDLEAELAIATQAVLTTPGLTRRDLLEICQHLVEASYGSGMLSANEVTYVVSLTAPLAAGEQISVDDYLEISRAFNRATGWPVPAVRYAFADVLVSYTALAEPAGTFVDDLVRGSPALALAQAARLLAHDAQLAAGLTRRIAGAPAPAMMALNPGLARGRLRVMTESELAAGVQPDRTEIVVLPQTVAELTPVAGIITGGEGNLLSHLQLLARNLGIPNVAVNAVVYRDVAALDGEDVVLAVDNAGSVVLEPVVGLSDEQVALVTQARVAIAPGSLDVPEPDLALTAPVALASLGRSLSGRVVGPKAANLGELHRLFPGRVSAAVALPFGLFDQHMRSGTPSLRDQLVAAYVAGRNGSLDDAALQGELARIRKAIAGLELDTASRERVLEAMRSEFGDADGYGIFIRSDTNVEDLPGFSGAGLSETLPNVVGRDRQLAGIAQVWASVLSPRSVAWRANLMKTPERVYASVLLMKSVGADKSGVLVTTDLVTHGSGATVSTAWGVGGAVAGEAAESLVLLPGGRERLLSEAKTPYQRVLNPEGGIAWLPAPDGAVLAADEKQQLRDLVSEVAARIDPVADSEGRPMPWDIEFGFENGRLTLFQIRPLVEKGARRAARVTRALVRKESARTTQRLRLGAPVNRPDEVPDAH